MAPSLVIFDDTILALRCRPGAIHPISDHRNEVLIFDPAVGRHRVRYRSVDGPERAFSGFSSGLALVESPVHCLKTLSGAG